jgi:hypothetical protein
MEELAAASSDPTSISDYPGGANPLTPLLATVIEQISSRFVASFSPSDTLAVVSFMRRLLVRLSGKQRSLEVLTHLSEKLASLPVGDVFEEKHTIVGHAVSQEIKILKNTLRLLGNPAIPTSPPGGPSSAVIDFLDRIENLPIRMMHRHSFCLCSAHQCLQPRQMPCVRVLPLNLSTVYALSILLSRRSQQCGLFLPCRASTVRRLAFF